MKDLYNFFMTALFWQGSAISVAFAIIRANECNATITFWIAVVGNLMMITGILMFLIIAAPPPSYGGKE